MGQLALGIRSLILKVAVFFVMAALLAWALGGTLFPRPERVDLEPLRFADQEWFMRLSVGGDHPGVAHYELMRVERGERPRPFLGPFGDAAGLVVHDNLLHAAVRNLPSLGSQWIIVRVDPDGTVSASDSYPDRLAIEQALADLRAPAGVPSADDD